tara:strand:+ start:348 stop:593 length:246 start_codon:yes stop_codon:yes gene_type:complete
MRNNRSTVLSSPPLDAAVRNAMTNNLMNLDEVMRVVVVMLVVVVLYSSNSSSNNQQARPLWLRQARAALASSLFFLAEEQQ